MPSSSSTPRSTAPRTDTSIPQVTGPGVARSGHTQMSRQGRRAADWTPSGALTRVSQAPPSRRANVTAMDLLVIGGSGFLGREVIRQAGRAGAQVGATFYRHPSAIAGVDWHALDIRHRDRVTALVQQTRPVTII